MKQAKEKKDFTSEELPKNRVELYFDVLIHQFRILFSSSALEDLFLLPLIADYLVFESLIKTNYSLTGTYDGIFALLFYGSLIAIPLIGVAYIGLAGQGKILKKLTYQEGVIVVSSFFDGIKENWKRAFLYGLLTGLGFFMAFLGTMYLLMFQSSNIYLTGFGIGLLMILFIVLFIMSMYSLSQDQVYATPLRGVMKNSFLFVFLGFGYNLLLLIFLPGLIILLLFINNITAYIGIGLSFLFNSLPMLAWVDLTHGVFDKYINRDNYPEMVGRGLAKKEDE